MIDFRHKGDFQKTSDFLKRSIGRNYRTVLKEYGQKGVDALTSNTPKLTGKTAYSWTYELVETRSSISVVWKNTNINEGVNIAIILQYGHGTRNGGYVQGLDYINPALRPIFEELANAAWKEVTAK